VLTGSRLHDLPLGPTDVALASAILVAVGAIREALRATRRPRRRDVGLSRVD
jgi:hypothetical protein